RIVIHIMIIGHNMPESLKQDFSVGSSIDSSKSNFCSLFLSYVTHPYCLLRSDVAINKLYAKLLEYVHQCQDRLCENLGYGEMNDFHEYNNISTAAFYLFGAYRLGVDRFDSSVLEQSMSFLKVNQLENGSFLSLEKYGKLSHEVNAIIAHVLWISETFGWERSLRRLTKYFLKTQDKYVFWSFTGLAQTGYLTGLILDTFELTKDNPRITFDIPEHKRKKNTTSVTKENYSFQQLINSIDPEIVQNIISEQLTVNIFGGRNKQSKKTPASPKNDTIPVKVKSPEEIKALERFAKAMKRVVFVVKDDENISLFIDEKLEPIKMPRAKLAPRFLSYLAALDEPVISASKVKGVSGSEDNPKKSDKNNKSIISKSFKKISTFF
ncbi:MAG: hypothetical protein JXI43_05950, partial [Tissierellales bacterium]|nr:hypothetical protein [Tissierellales bacterium]